MQVGDVTQGVLRQLYQVAALHRLHHDDRFAMLCAYLAALPSLDGRTVIAHIVQLQLHKFHLWVFGQDLIQHLRLIVEGKSHMADESLRFQLQRLLIGPALLKFLKIHLALGVHQVKIKVLHPAAFQLLLEQRPHLFLRLKQRVENLIRQQKALPR